MRFHPHTSPGKLCVLKPHLLLYPSSALAFLLATNTLGWGTLKKKQTAWKLSVRDTDAALVEKSIHKHSITIIRIPGLKNHPRYHLVHALPLDKLKVERRRKCQFFEWADRKIRKSFLGQPTASPCGHTACFVQKH